MRRSILIATTLLFAASAGAQTESVLPLLPDEHWIALDPGDVEATPAYASYSDVFLRSSGGRWTESPIHTAYPAVTQPETFTDLGNQLRDLWDSVATSPRFNEPANNGARLRSNLLGELERLLADVNGRAATKVNWANLAEIVDDRFQQRDGEWRNHKPEGGADELNLSTNSAFFARLPTQVILRLDAADPGSLNPAEGWRYYATVEQSIEFRTVALRVSELFNTAWLPQLQQTSMRLGEINQAWDRYLNKGFSQYPWESLLNSYVTDFSWTRPPRSQWVLLHPELSLVGDVRSSSTAQFEPGLLVHGLGYVRYSSDHDWFAGLSASASLTSDSAFGVGYGATLHFGHSKIYSKVPHISLSVLWHEFDTGGNGPVVALSLDLGRFFSDGGEEIFRDVLPDVLSTTTLPSPPSPTPSR